MTKTRPTPERAKKAQGRQPSRKSVTTRQKILDAAAAEFARNGFGATRLSDIAEAATIHLSGLYYHFDTKEALATEVIALVPSQAASAIDTTLTALPADATHQQRIGAAIKVYLQFILKGDNYIRAGLQIAQEGPPDIREQAVAITRAESEVLRTLLEDARADGAIRDDVDMTMARMILFGAMNWAIEWFRPGHGRLSAEAFADQVIKVFFRGVAPEISSR